MIAALVFVISIGSLLQFFFSYCHALLLSVSTVEISEQLRQVTGFRVGVAAEGDVERLVGWARLCPELGEKAAQVRAVGLYFRFLVFLERLARLAIPLGSGWVEDECRGCAHFVAVVLDRRIRANQGLIAEEMAAY